MKRNGGETPLHIAAIFSHYEIAKLLISKGADVSVRNYAGITPLDLAKYKKPEISDLLRKYGAKTPEEFKAKGK